MGAFHVSGYKHIVRFTLRQANRALDNASLRLQTLQYFAAIRAAANVPARDKNPADIFVEANFTFDAIQGQTG